MPTADEQSLTRREVYLETLPFAKHRARHDPHSFPDHPESLNGPMCYRMIPILE